MMQQNAVVIVIDRLGAGWLSPYGNTWLDTPELNRMAGQSLLLENAIADAPRLPGVYWSYWQGLHAGDGARPGNDSACLPAEAAAHGYRTLLVTDEAEVAEHSLAAAFGQLTVLPPPNARHAAKDVADTGIAELFAAAIEKLVGLTPPFLLWVHARGLQGPWDAPGRFRERFADEDDPTPPEFVEVPSWEAGSNDDPDRLLGVMQAYAGQVAVVDVCLGVLWDALQSLPFAQSTLLMFTSPRGFALGEHGRVGPVDDALYGELLHVPWLIHAPGTDLAAARGHLLVQPPDLHATLAAWLGLSGDRPGRGRNLLSASPDQLLDSHSRTDRAFATAPGQYALRTPAWFLRQAENEPPQLFAKPDDRWEVNEVADRCAEVVALLQQEYETLRRSVPGEPLADLPDVLVERLS